MTAANFHRSDIVLAIGFRANCSGIAHVRDVGRQVFGLLLASLITTLMAGCAPWSLNLPANLLSAPARAPFDSATPDAAETKAPFSRPFANSRGTGSAVTGSMAAERPAKVGPQQFVEDLLPFRDSRALAEFLSVDRWEAKSPQPQRAPFWSADSGWSFTRDTAASPPRPIEADSEPPPATVPATATGDQSKPPADAAELPSSVLPTSNTSSLLVRAADRTPASWLERYRDIDESEVLTRLKSLAHRKSMCGVNATLLLARLSPADCEHPEILRGVAFAGSDDKLVDEESGRTLKWCQQLSATMDMRLAAAEAWVRVLRTHHADPEIALAPVGHLLTDVPLTELAESLLWRELAKDIPPQRIPQLTAALEAESADSTKQGAARRIAALDACVEFAVHHQDVSADAAGVWPARLHEQRRHPDAAVRQAYGRWVATAHPPQALELLQQQLLDADASVRQATFLAIGQLGGAAATDLLQQRFRQADEVTRLAIVAGLAEIGVDALQPAIKDESFRVRREVARHLAQREDAAHLTTLRQLIVDRHPEVQEATANGLAAWTLDVNSLLLLGLADGSAETRRSCHHALETRTGKLLPPLPDDRNERRTLVEQWAGSQGLSLLDLAGYRADLDASLASREHRAARLGELIDAFVAAHAVDTASSAASHNGSASVETLDHNSRAWAEQLRELHPTPVELGLVEQRLLALPAADRRLVMQSLLADFEPSFVSLRELESSDVLVRRSAAQRLADRGRAASLSPLVVRELADRLTREQDALVWRFCFAAIERDVTSESEQIARLALQQPWPDLQVLGCDYAREHAAFGLGPDLVPLLSSSRLDVQLAAIHAAGVCRNPVVIAPRDQPGLRTLLRDRKREVSTAAAISLVRLGDDAGLAEVIRLFHAPEATVRRETAVALASSGQRQLVPLLIKTGWTEPNADVKTALVETIETLTPAHEHPPGLAAARSTNERLQLWLATIP